MTVIKTPANEGQERYRVTGQTIEQAERDMLKYEATPSGKRFTSSLRRADDFKPWKQWGGLCAEHYIYLLNMADAKGADRAIVEACKLAYRAGYMAGQRAEKQKNTGKAAADPGHKQGK